MYSIYFKWIEEYSLENVLIVVLVNKRKRYIIMKKKLITIVIGAMLCAGLFAGCGQSDTKQDKAAAGTESAKQADTKDEGDKGSQEEKELTGTIDDIKDFMFVVTDDKDTPYSFTFDDTWIGMPQNPGSPGTYIVDHFISIHIGNMGTFCTLNKTRRTPYSLVRTYRAVHASRKPEFCSHIK